MALWWCVLFVLPAPHLVVRVHHGHEERAWRHRRRDRARLDAALPVDRHVRHLEPPRGLERLQALRHRRVLHIGRDHVRQAATGRRRPLSSAARLVVLDDAEDGVVVRLRAAAGEDDLVRLCADQLRHRRALALFTAVAHDRPKACPLDGLPQWSCRNGIAASATSGHTGLVAW